LDSGRGGGIEFVLCAIDTHPVCLNSNYTVLVSKEEAPKDTEEAELGLVNLSCPIAVQLLEDPCIWIGDTAPMVHMPPHAVGMVPNQEDGHREQMITVVNGMQEITTMHGTIKGEMVNRNGLSVATAVLNNVAYSPQMKYNFV